MRVETIYYAFDESEFSTREACEEYERSFMENSKSVVFLSDLMFPIKTTELAEVEQAVYFKVRDWKRAKGLFAWMRDDAAIRDLPDLDETAQDKIFMWDENDGWMVLDEKLKKLQDLYNDLQREFVEVENEL